MVMIELLGVSAIDLSNVEESVVSTTARKTFRNSQSLEGDAGLSYPVVEFRIKVHLC